MYYYYCCLRLINILTNFYRWADQCKNYPHDKNRQTDDFNYVGQNFAWITAANFHSEEIVLGPLIKVWYDEVIKNDSIGINHINNFN